jgi:hypothetical protein
VRHGQLDVRQFQWYRHWTCNLLRRYTVSNNRKDLTCSQEPLQPSPQWHNRSGPGAVSRSARRTVDKEVIQLQHSFATTGRSGTDTRAIHSVVPSHAKDLATGFVVCEVAFS